MKGFWLTLIVYVLALLVVFGFLLVLGLTSENQWSVFGVAAGVGGGVLVLALAGGMIGFVTQRQLSVWVPSAAGALVGLGLVSRHGGLLLAGMAAVVLMSGYTIGACAGELWRQRAGR